MHPDVELGSCISKIPETPWDKIIEVWMGSRYPFLREDLFCPKYIDAKHFAPIQREIEILMDRWELAGNSRQEAHERLRRIELGKAFRLDDPCPSWDQLETASLVRAAKILELPDPEAVTPYQLFEAYERVGYGYTARSLHSTWCRGTL